MLLPDERDYLVSQVADITNSDPDTLKPIIGWQHVIQIDTHKKPIVYANLVVQYCERSAWIENPALILKVLEIFSFDLILNPVYERLKKAGPTRYFNGNRPWDTCLLALELPFLNREKSRMAIELFNNPLVPDPNEFPIKTPGVRVLVVNGPPKTGKTFTINYIRYTTSFQGNNFKIAWVDYKKEINSRFGPDDLIRSLLNQINFRLDESSIPKLDHAQSPRWIMELASFLVSQIVATGIPRYIILDGFDNPAVPKETIELIQRIAAIAVGLEQSVSNDSIRLVLLGFKESITNYKDRVMFEETGPIIPKDVELYFKRYSSYKQWPPFGHGVLQKIVDQVFHLSPPWDHPEHVKKLAENSLKIAHSIERSFQNLKSN